MAETIDTNGATWQAIKAWADQRLKMHRTQLEAPGLPMTETEVARCAIRELNLLLALPNQKSIQTTHTNAVQTD
jgi:hypothetical protein